MKSKMTFWICLTFILLASIGFSFAWFSTQIEGNDTAKMVTTSSSILKLVFDDSGEDITLSNMHPGDFVEKTITIENTGTEPSGYKLEWLELQNEFYSMEIRIEGTCTSYKDGVVTGTCESFEKGVGGSIIHRVDSIGVGYTHEYNIKILFKETDKLQNYNQGKNFSGKIGVSDYARPVPVYANGVKPVNNCTFDGELVQGAEYVNGQYTYKYMQELVVNEDTGDEIWMPISEDGWGVVLTDKVSTNPVTTKLCTSINNKSIVSMSMMFSSSQASSIDFSSFDTSNVKNMTYMFGSGVISELDLGNFDTSNVTNMQGMFYVYKGTSINLGSFDTSNVTDMSFMFGGCYATELDLSKFDTSKVTDMRGMLAFTKTSYLDLSSFDTSNVTNMYGMFNTCNLETLDLSSFDTSNVTSMYEMFRNSYLLNLNIQSFNTGNVVDMANMFEGVNTSVLDLRHFDTSAVTGMSYMFSGADAEEFYIDNFDTSNVTDMSYMFEMTEFPILDLSSFDASNVINIENMFDGCYETEEVYARTVYDAEIFNDRAVTSLPSHLEFIVK